MEIQSSNHTEGIFSCYSESTILIVLKGFLHILLDVFLGFHKVYKSCIKSYYINFLSKNQE